MFKENDNFVFTIIRFNYTNVDFDVNAIYILLLFPSW